MNFLSLNIRGLGGNGKAGKVKLLKERNGVKYLGIQETHMENIDSFDFHQMWGNDGFDFDVVNAFGRSGGILNVWDPKVFTKSFSVKHQNFLLTSGCLVEDGTVFNCVNVYAPQK